jgi:hypothetical protein
MANTKKYVSLDKLGLYDEKIKKVIADGDAAALASAKTYADGLATNYDAAGSAASALADAKSYADGKDAAIQAAHKAGTDAAAAAAVADGKAVAAQGEVDALEAYVGTFTASEGVDTVVKYIDAKTANIASDETVSALDARVTQAEKDIDAIEADYLKAADKTELEGKITAAQNAADAAAGAVEALSGTHATDKKALEDAIALKADQTALDGVSAVANAAVKQSDYDVKVKALEDEDVRIVGLVEAEADRAATAEGKLDERLTEVEAFFKLAEGEQLDTALDTLVEIQTYITGEGAAADQMVLDIAANKKAIEDHMATDHDFATADATLKAELNGEIAKKADKTTVEGIDGRLTTAEGKITTVEGKVSTLEGQMTTVQDAVATKAEAQALTDAVSALEGADTAIKGRLDTLEAKFNGEEGSVSDMIADAKQEAIDTASGDATSKANAAEAAAKGHADSLNTAMNTRVEALEAIDHDHSNKAELDLIASGDKAKWDEAYAKRHEHSNLTVLEGITAAKVTAWDAAEGNAKTYADGLNTAMDTRVATLETWHSNFIEVSEEEINNLFA